MESGWGVMKKRPKDALREKNRFVSLPLIFHEITCTGTQTSTSPFWNIFKQPFNFLKVKTSLVRFLFTVLNVELPN